MLRSQSNYAKTLPSETFKLMSPQADDSRGAAKIGSLRASDTDRDAVLDVLAKAVSDGKLTLEEHDARSQLALQATQIADLKALTSDLVAPPRAPEQRSSSRTGVVAVVGLILIAAVIIGVAVGHRSPTGSVTQTTVATPGELPPSTAVSSEAAYKGTPSPLSPVADGLTIRTMPPGVFGKHDPADECGAFGTATTVGGTNCYVVVQFTNVTASAVTFTPADLRMVDQTGDTYRIGPILPACYDTVDMNAPQVLAPKAQLTIQWCTGVMTGALPQTIKGTGSLAGIVLRVPPTSIFGTWGGA